MAGKRQRRLKGQQRSNPSDAQRAHRRRTEFYERDGWLLIPSMYADMTTAELDEFSNALYEDVEAASEWGEKINWAQYVNTSLPIPRGRETGYPVALSGWKRLPQIDSWEINSGRGGYEGLSIFRIPLTKAKQDITPMALHYNFVRYLIHLRTRR
jgi:hypothetical protein